MKKSLAIALFVGILSGVSAYAKQTMLSVWNHTGRTVYCKYDVYVFKTGVAGAQYTKPRIDHSPVPSHGNLDLPLLRPEETVAFFGLPAYFSCSFSASGAGTQLIKLPQPGQRGYIVVEVSEPAAGSSDPQIYAHPA